MNPLSDLDARFEQKTEHLREAIVPSPGESITNWLSIGDVLRENSHDLRVT
jgi:hypothetical protein